MIAANVAAARALEAKKAPVMNRVHEPPSREKLVALKDYLATFGIEFALGQVIKPGTFNRIIERVGESDGREEIMEQLLRTQMQARYGPDRLGHFGLALATYAHFTSPIRRYADLLVHRALVKAYKGERKIAWMEVLAGQKAFDETKNWLPDETVEAFRTYLVGIKVSLTTPVCGGIRSLNVALRQMLDLYACVRPVQWFTGVPSPVKRPQDVDMVIFRENTEDIYAGIEWAAGSPEAQKVLAFIEKEFPKDFKKVRFPMSTAVGFKPISKDGTRASSAQLSSTPSTTSASRSRSSTRATS
jgi:hypothetical protein